MLVATFFAFCSERQLFHVNLCVVHMQSMNFPIKRGSKRYTGHFPTPRNKSIRDILILLLIYSTYIWTHLGWAKNYGSIYRVIVDELVNSIYVHGLSPSSCKSWLVTNSHRPSEYVGKEGETISLRVHRQTDVHRWLANNHSVRSR